MNDRTAKFRHLDFHLVKIEFPGLDLGQIQDVIADRQQMGAGIIYVVSLLPVLCNAGGAKPFVLDNL